LARVTSRRMAAIGSWFQRQWLTSQHKCGMVQGKYSVTGDSLLQINQQKLNWFAEIFHLYYRTPPCCVFFNCRVRLLNCEVNFNRKSGHCMKNTAR
jgi:hypothetical protein